MYGKYYHTTFIWDLDYPPALYIEPIGISVSIFVPNRLVYLTSNLAEALVMMFTHQQNILVADNKWIREPGSGQ